MDVLELMEHVFFLDVFLDVFLDFLGVLIGSFWNRCTMLTYNAPV